jgi:hypothetical protein
MKNCYQPSDGNRVVLGLTYRSLEDERPPLTTRSLELPPKEHLRLASIEAAGYQGVAQFEIASPSSSSSDPRRRLALFWFSAHSQTGWYLFEVGEDFPGSVFMTEERTGVVTDGAVYLFNLETKQLERSHVWMEDYQPETPRLIWSEKIDKGCEDFLFEDGPGTDTTDDDDDEKPTDAAKRQLDPDEEIE